ncbi:MAG: TonB-dependent receptor, partial [Candidatus Omnitrophota bacterium]
LWTQRSRINTYGVTPKYTLEHTIFDRDNKLITGVDEYVADYTSNKYDQSNDDDLKTHTRIRKTSVAGYLNDEFKVIDKLTLSGGYRLEQAAYLFNYHDATGWNPDIHSQVHYDQWAAHTGLAYSCTDVSTLYGDVSRSLRFPEVDEFTYNDGSWQQQLNTSLRPQAATTYQLGVRQKINDWAKADVSVYRMHLTDELYYNSTGGPLAAGQNQNYDKTVHEGLNLSLESELTRRISMTGAYTYTHAYFHGGDYDKNQIPLVAHHKFSTGVKVSLPADMVWHVTGIYVGKRYTLNDQANSHGLINGYAVVNTSLTWQKKDWSVSAGINNLFNKQYAEYAGWATNPATSAPDRFYYPSPERNYTVGMTRKF